RRRLCRRGVRPRHGEQQHRRPAGQGDPAILHPVRGEPRAGGRARLHHHLEPRRLLDDAAGVRTVTVTPAEGPMPLPVGVFLALGAVSATAGLAGALLAFGASAGIAAAVCFAGALGLGFAALASHRARGYGEIRSALAILCAALGATGTMFAT